MKKITVFLLIFAMLLPFAGMLPVYAEESGVATTDGNETMLASFHLMYDVHINRNTDAGYATAFENSLKQMANINADTSIGLVIGGDNTQNGTAAEMETFYGLLDTNNPVEDGETIVIMGNHEARGPNENGNWVEDPNLDNTDANYPYWSTATSLYKTYNAAYMPASAQETLYHSKELGGYTFIALNTEKGLKDSMWMSDEYLEWFENELKTAYVNDPTKPIFVISHQALKDTSWNTWSRGMEHYNADYKTGLDDKVKAILAKYPTTVFINGHLHNTLEEIELVVRPYTTCIDVPAAFTDKSGLGYEVEIYASKIVFRAINFATGTYVEGEDLTVSTVNGGVPAVYQAAVNRATTDADKALVEQLETMLTKTYVAETTTARADQYYYTNTDLATINELCDTLATNLELSGMVGVSDLSMITDLDGRYYLMSDIGSADALSSTQIPAGFTGTLEGNGKTIYTSVPVFVQLGEGATIRNLILDGAIEKAFTASAAATFYLGALAESTATDANEGIICLENITNNVDITFSVNTSTKKATINAGGLIGAVQCVINAKNCVNNGALKMTGLTADASSGLYFGGLVGVVQNITSTARSQYVDCSNNGDITCDFTFEDRWLLVSGMIGYNKAAVSFVDCENNGDITVTDHGTGTTEIQTGKVAGFVSYNNTTAACEYINCINTGNLSGARAIGGISSFDLAPGIVKGCVNKGNIIVTDEGESGKNYALGGGIIAYPLYSNTVASNSLIFEDCVNQGNITVDATHGSQWLGGIAGYTACTAGTFAFVRCGNAGSVSVGSVSTWGGKLGGIFGLQSGGTAVKVNFAGCYNSGTVSGPAQVGGIAGQLYGISRFVSCVNAGTVTYTAGVQHGNFSGIVGHISKTTDTKINNCINKGTVSSTKGHVAGIVGAGNENTVISHCENAGTLERTGGTPYAISIETEWLDGSTTIQPAVQTNCYDRAGDDKLSANSTLVFQGVQRSIATEGEETFSLRFITKVQDIEDYQSTGVMVYFTKSGAAGVKTCTYDTTTVYKQIGGSGKNYPEVAQDGVYYSALTVSDISVSGGYSFIVVPYIVDLNGEYVYEDAYLVDVNDGSVANPVALSHSGLSFGGANNTGSSGSGVDINGFISF